MVQLWKIPDATLRLEKPTTKIPDLDIELADDKLKNGAVNVKSSFHPKHACNATHHGRRPTQTVCLTYYN